MNLGQGVIQKIILVSALITIFSSCTIGSDDDENFYFANSNNNKFFANSRRNCQPNYYFDVDYFKCRLCDGNFHLTVSKQSEWHTHIVHAWVLPVSVPPPFFVKFMPYNM